MPGHAEAIDRICAELDQWRCGIPGRSWWPGMISPAEWKARAVGQPGPQRPSWCYGVPGMARAQQLAALALGDRRRQHQAENALAGCVTDEKQLAQLGDASVCHGWAGLVVPLHWRGQARSVAFVHEDGVLRAIDSQLCGFIPMIGDGQDGERTGQIADDVALYFDRDQPIDLDVLQGVLDQPKITVWSGASVVPNESTDLIWPRLTGTEPGTCRFAANDAAVEAGLCNPAFPYRSPALVEGDSLAYLTMRGPDLETTERRWELGAIGHGPAGAQLAERLCEQIRIWGRDRTVQPAITAYPAGTPDQVLADGVVIDKQFIRLVVSS